MGDLSVTILAAEEGGGQSNFLIPNGTFFFVLLIFLIVLGVIAKWVVPPISKVLREREAMVQQDDRGQPAGSAITGCRGRRLPEGDGDSAPRGDRRPRGGPRRGAQDRRRRAGRASAEVSSVLQQANEELTEQSRAVTADLQTSVETLAASLASRVLGVEVTTRTVPATTGQGR